MNILQFLLVEAQGIVSVCQLSLIFVQFLQLGCVSYNLKVSVLKQLLKAATFMFYFGCQVHDWLPMVTDGLDNQKKASERL